MEENTTPNQEEIESTEEDVFEDVEDTDDDDLFAGLDEEVKPTESDNDVEESKQEEVEQSKTNPDTEEPFLTVRYNKEDTNLTKEKAIEMAQKGMNYDKLMGDFNSFKSQIEDLAARSGVDVNTFIANLKNTIDQNEVDNTIAELKQQYPNSDDALIDKMARTMIANKYQEQASKMDEAKTLEKNQKMDEIKRQLDIAKKIYPNEDYEHLPKDVIGMMKEGSTIVEALAMYKQVQNQSIKKQEDVKAKASAKNEENKKKSLGNTTNTSNEMADDFDDGFDSMF